MPASATHLRIQESHHRIERLDNFRILQFRGWVLRRPTVWKDVKQVIVVLHDDELMRNVMSLQGRRHSHRFIERDISVLVAVEEECRRVFLGDVADRAKPLELLGFPVRVNPRDFPRPEAVLLTVVVESNSGKDRTSREHLPTDDLVGLFLLDPIQIEIVGIGPLFSDVAVAIEGDQGFGPRLQEKSAHQRQVAACGVANEGHVVRVDPEQLRTFLPHPLIGILQVFDDLRKLRFGSEPVVDGNNHIPGLKITLQLMLSYRASIGKDQRATMDPKDDRPNLLTREPVDIRLDRRSP